MPHLLAILTAALLNTASAQDTVLEPDPAFVPSAGIATENGPGTLWVNPANLAYDADPRWGLFFRRAPDSPHPFGGAATAGVRGFSGGLRWNRDAERFNDFVVDLALGFELPQRVAVGAAMKWNLVSRRRNFVAFDVGASWRPLPWIGMSAVTRNLGNPGDDDIALPQTGVGLAVRPIGRVLLLGADFVYTFGGYEPPAQFLFTTRVRFTEGLFLRASLDNHLALGAGLEFYFGGFGFGAHAGTQDYDGLPDIRAWFGSDEPDENLTRSKRRVTRLQIDEAPDYQPVGALLERADRSWLETLEHFREAARDRSVRGMVVSLSSPDLSWAQWREVRQWILALRAIDKNVVAYLNGAPSNGAVYAASAASEVYVHPASTLQLTELGTELLHLGGLMDAVGVEVQVVRRSEYKTAAEQLVSLEPSEANLIQRRALLDDLRSELADALATGRGRPRSDAEAWLTGGPWTAAEAEQRGIVDGRAYPDQLRRKLEQLFDGPVRQIDLAEQPRGESPWDAPARIGVVYIEGTIVSGVSQPGGFLSGRTTGASTVAEELDRLARDVAVRAVVLRIDSPGGSAFSSDEIWRSVQRVKASGKPVVVSMGGVAASGGYYVATAADAIWAEPTTVTGSIGVLAVKSSFGPLLDTLGVRTTSLDTGRSANLDSPFRAWEPLQLSRMDALVADSYERFKERVARGRGLSPDAVEAAARGRVWSGRAAQELGLVDRLGGFTDALEHARELAGIADRRPVAWVDARVRRTFLRQLLSTPLRPRLRPPVSGALRSAEPLLEPLSAAWTLSQHGEESLWMIDPWWTRIGPR
jgi:protease-4